jgi:hypothetical protein
MTNKEKILRLYEIREQIKALSAQQKALTTEAECLDQELAQSPFIAYESVIYVDSLEGIGVAVLTGHPDTDKRLISFVDLYKL